MSSLSHPFPELHAYVHNLKCFAFSFILGYFWLTEYTVIMLIFLVKINHLKCIFQCTDYHNSVSLLLVFCLNIANIMKHSCFKVTVSLIVGPLSEPCCSPAGSLALQGVLHRLQLIRILRLDFSQAVGIRE